MWHECFITYYIVYMQLDDVHLRNEGCKYCWFFRWNSSCTWWKTTKDWTISFKAARTYYDIISMGWPGIIKSYQRQTQRMWLQGTVLPLKSNTSCSSKKSFVLWRQLLFEGKLFIRDFTTEIRHIFLLLPKCTSCPILLLVFFMWDISLQENYL